MFFKQRDACRPHVATTSRNVSISMEITIFDQAIQRKWHVADLSEMELAKAVRRALEDGEMAEQGYIAEGEHLTKPIATYQGNPYRLTITFF